jgi:hypothetical protein
MFSLGSMVRARQQTSARDAQHLRKLGSHSAHAPEGSLAPPTGSPHPTEYLRICELYERELTWPLKKIKKSTIIA